MRVLVRAFLVVGALAAGACAPPVCNDSIPCADWQTCKPTGPATGVCEDVAIVQVAPASGTTMAGTASAVFRFQVTQWDGGVLERASVPVLAKGGGLTGPTTLSQVGSVFQGEFLLANVRGPQSVTAGWSEVNSTISVNTEVCSATCAEWQECRPTKNGGECVSLDVQLSVGAFLDGGTVGKNAPVPVQAKVWRADGGARPGAVPFRTTKGLKGTLAQAADYTTAIDGGSESGAVEVVVGWEDGGPYVKGRYLVDITPPVLGLVVVSDGGAYQRDAVVPAIVTSDEAVTDAGLVLGGVAMARTGISSCPGYSGTTGAVGCFLLDFSQPELRALDGGFAVALIGTDLFGNSGPTTGPTLPVTRVRWTVTPTAHQVQALALGSDGTLYVGTSIPTTTTGEIAKLDPASGSATFSAQNASVQGLATADGVLYFSANNQAANRGSIGAADTASLSVSSQQAPCQGVPSSRTYSGIALYKSSSGAVLAVGAVNASGYGCVYSPAGPYSTFAGTTRQFDAPVVPGWFDTATNVVISTATLTASLLRGDGSTGAWWQPVALTASGPSPTAGTAVQLGGDTNTLPVGQALLGGTAFVGACRATVDSKVFAMAGGGADGGSLGGTRDKGVPAFASATEGYVGDGAILVRFNPSVLSTSGTPLYTSLSNMFFVDAIRTSPILGAARSDGGTAEGYAVSRAGTLVVFTQGSSTDTWAAPLGFGVGSAVVTHPTLDCNRVTRSANTGILYVGDDQGTVKAIVVDSPRLLETAGAWPKYQRSAGNAGNDDTTNFPTNWGGCP